MSSLYYTDEEFIDVVPKCRHWTEAADRLNIPRFSKTLRIHGGWHTKFKHDAHRLSVDISHMKGGGGGKKKSKRRGKLLDEQAFTYGSGVSRGTLKKRLIKNGLKEECAICALVEWQGKKIKLHLDHIDGIGLNNVQSNLRLLCPNCHSQTATYSRRNNAPVAERYTQHHERVPPTGIGSSNLPRSTKFVVDKLDI